jgi:hypothetical protein
VTQRADSNYDPYAAGGQNFTIPQRDAPYENDWQRQQREMAEKQAGRPLAPTRDHSVGLERQRYEGMAAPVNTGGPQIGSADMRGSRALSMSAIDALRMRAEGQETPAQRLAMAQTQGAVNAVQSGAAGVRGGAGMRAAAARQAQGTGARVGAFGAQDLQALKAREQADAAGQFFGASSAQRGRDLGVAGDQAGLDLAQRAANDDRERFYEGLRFGTQKQHLDESLGRDAAASAAANTARAQGMQEDAARWGRGTDVASAATGAVTGAVDAYGRTRQPQKSDDPWDPSNYSGGR